MLDVFSEAELLPVKCLISSADISVSSCVVGFVHVLLRASARRNKSALIAPIECACVVPFRLCIHQPARIKVRTRDKLLFLFTKPASGAECRASVGDTTANVYYVPRCAII